MREIGDFLGEGDRGVLGEVWEGGGGGVKEYGIEGAGWVMDGGQEEVKKIGGGAMGKGDCGMHSDYASRESISPGIDTESRKQSFLSLCRVIQHKKVFLMREKEMVGMDRGWDR